MPLSFSKNSSDGAEKISSALVPERLFNQDSTMTVSAVSKENEMKERHLFQDKKKK